MLPWSGLSSGSHARAKGKKMSATGYRKGPVLFQKRLRGHYIFPTYSITMVRTSNPPLSRRKVAFPRPLAWLTLTCLQVSVSTLPPSLPALTWGKNSSNLLPQSVLVLILCECCSSPSHHSLLEAGVQSGIPQSLDYAWHIRVLVGCLFDLKRADTEKDWVYKEKTEVAQLIVDTMTCCCTMSPVGFVPGTQDVILTDFSCQMHAVQSEQPPFL